jgi:hypothetical protein
MNNKRKMKKKSDKSLNSGETLSKFSIRNKSVKMLTGGGWEIWSHIEMIMLTAKIQKILAFVLWHGRFQKDT